ncbi:MAG: PAS domain-containing sensor histidine kinase [Actinomycetota bacterium]
MDRPTGPGTDGSRALRDLVVVALSAAGSFALFLFTGAAASIEAWLRRSLGGSEDEFILAFGIAAIAMAVLTAMRWRDASRHLAARRAAEERYRAVVEKIPAVTYTWDPTRPAGANRVLYVSPQVEPILGFSVEDWTDDPELWMRQIHPDDREAVLGESERADRTGEPFVAEYRHRRPDGRYVWIHEEAISVPSGPNAAAIVQGVMYDISERRHAEERLREAEERYRTLVERVPAVTYIWDSAHPEGRPMRYVSPQIEPILGMSAEEWMRDATAWSQHVDPRDLPRVIDAWNDAKARGIPFRAEYRVVRGDGMSAWVRDEALPIASDDEGQHTYQGVLLDITELKRADERLRDAEARYRTLVEQLPAITYVESADGHTEYISPQIETFLGFTPAEWMADHDLWGGQLHPDDRDRVLEENARAYEPGHAFSIDYRIFARDGHMVWLHNEAVPVLDDDGGLEAWQGVVLDITAQKEAEAQLRAAEERYRAIVEHVPGAIYIDVPDGSMRTIYASPQIRAILGVSPDEWTANPDLWLEIMHPEDRDEMQRTYLQAAETGEAWTGEYRVLHPDGRWVWVHDETTFVHDENGEPLFLQGVLFDITERRRAEQALVSSERREREAAERLRTLDEMKNTFLAAVSHELRSPLTSILGLSLTLQQQDISPVDRADLLGRLASNARKLDRLLGDLLDIDRLNRGIVTPVYRTVDLADLIRRTVENLDLIGDRSIVLDLADVVVEADPAKVERIVENLVVNGLRHTSRSVTVWIRLREEPGGALIAVEDDGPGVPAELRREIFAPFRQGPTASAHSPGTGIGLSLVSMFAELHGGRAWVEERSGGGASFRVFLPATPPESPSVEDAAPGPEHDVAVASSDAG